MNNLSDNLNSKNTGAGPILIENPKNYLKERKSKNNINKIENSIDTYEIRNENFPSKIF
jgi:hypothetical protein